MQIQRQPFPSLAMQNVGGTDRWRKAPERKISQKWEKKENMSNEQVPGLPQLHDPILSWYILLLLEYFSSEVSTPIASGRELEIQLQVEILSTLIEHKEFLCTLKKWTIGLKPSSKMQFLLINEQLTFPEHVPPLCSAIFTALRDDFYWPQGSGRNNPEV